MDPKQLKILVTGGRGFLGSHVVEELKRQGFGNLTVVSGKKDGDLREQSVVRDTLKRTSPDWVLHFAGLVGGIMANKEHPAQYFYDNLSMGIMLMHESWKTGAKKFFTCIGGCSYPAKADSPIGEDALWEGYPQIESAAYSVGKKMMVVQSEAYRREYGFNSVVLVPGNMYGPRDNFDLQQSHVIPALIRKVLEAKKKGASEIEMWGSGKPVRDFVYVADVAKIIVDTLPIYNESQIVNISSGVGVTIRELVDTVVELTGFKGKVTWNTSKPDGQMRKIFDVTRMKTALHAECPTNLREGLKHTIDWYQQNHS